MNSTVFALTDSRRLTGANLFWDLPAAIIDVRFDHARAPELAERVTDAWVSAARDLLRGVGHADEQLTWRLFDGGASYLVSAPIDALYAMCELNETAWSFAVASLAGSAPPGLEQQITRLRALFEQEARPDLIELQVAARKHGVPFLWDDDEVSVGYGATAKVWAHDALPNPGEVDWDQVGSIPAALVTGTNGKSTTVRMAAAMIAAAGRRAGLTSTDWIRVGEHTLDTGDYSGTGGARMLMRHPETEIAVLETARGGLLRRGLGIERANAALITNVDADHLGDYGINTVPELVEAKFIVRRALGPAAPLLLNADDEGIVAFSASLDCPVYWFGLNAERQPLRDHLAAGGTAACLDDGMMVLAEKGVARPIIAVEDVPVTLGGAARHNISNALGALLLCHQLGLQDEALRQGLAGFRGDEHDNPGRGNWFHRGDIRILVDFAHNPHGMSALTEMLGNIPAKRRILMMGQAGDRPDQDIASMTVAACGMRPDRLLACELPGYERGRQAMEVPHIIRGAALSAGLASAAVELWDSPDSAAASALEQAKPGDLLVFLALSQRQQVLERVHRFVDEPLTFD